MKCCRLMSCGLAKLQKKTYYSLKRLSYTSPKFAFKQQSEGTLQHCPPDYAKKTSVINQKTAQTNILDYQYFTKKLQNNDKKNTKNLHNVLEIYLPLQRFNKQMIVLQI